MADQLQLRGGTTTEHATFTGALREVTVDTTKDTVVVHDNATAGGHPLMRENGSNSALALGSAATPSLKFTGDINTGIYSPGADQVAISTNGTGRLFVDSGGNVGIAGTPSNPLDVFGSALLGIRYKSSGSYAGIVADNTSSTGGGYFGAYQNGIPKVYFCVTGAILADTSADAGLFAETGQAIRFFTNGSATEKARIRSDGMFEVRGDGTAGASPAFSVNGSAPANSAQIDSSGRLLVGTSSTSQTASVVVEARDPGAGIYVNTSSGVAGGASSPSYGLYVEGRAWNNATHQYGVYAKQTQQLVSPVTVGYFEGSGVYSTLYGVHSKIDKNLAGVTNGYCYYANLSYSGSGGEAAFGYWYNDTDALLRFKFKANGGIDNYSSNDTNLCDIREKKNIEDLDSTWDCLKHWELKKFHYNEDSDTDDKRYGVIAQQVAEFCPEVIADWTKQQSEPAVIDENGNEIEPAKEAIVRMGVKEQQMYWMAIKALQEAQVRIEALEAEVAALKAQ